MAAGTATVLGPYALNDTVNIAADLTTEGGAVIKTITSYQDIENRQVWFVVVTAA